MLLSLGTWPLGDPGRRWRGPGTPGAGLPACANVNAEP